MLSKDAAQVNLAGFGCSIGLLAFAPGQFLRDHRYAGAIGADIQNGNRTALALVRSNWPFLPLLGGAANALDYPLDLAGRNADTSGLLEVALGFEIRRLVRSLQAQEFGQSRCVTAFQTKGVISRVMPLLFSGIMVVITVEREAAEHSLRVEGVAALVDFAGLGLVGLIDSVGRLLEQPADQFVGGLKDRCPEQGLQLRDEFRLGALGLKSDDQLLDFLILRQEDVLGEFFFFEPAMLWRVCAMTISAYC